MNKKLVPLMILMNETLGRTRSSSSSGSSSNYAQASEDDQEIQGRKSLSTEQLVAYIFTFIAIVICFLSLGYFINKYLYVKPQKAEKLYKKFVEWKNREK